MAKFCPRRSLVASSLVNLQKCRSAQRYGLGLHRTWEVDEIDTQIFQEPFGTRENPRGRGLIFTISQGLVGNLDVYLIHPPIYVQA